MFKTTLEPPTLQTISGKQIDFCFTPVPESIEKDIDSPALERLFRIILGYVRRGLIDPSLRLLARRMRRSVRQVQRGIARLKRLGWIVCTERRLLRNRNLTNVFSIPHLERGVGDINVTEKKREVLKTNTPAPKRGVISRLQTFWEKRFAQDRKDSAWRRAEYEHRAKVWEEAKGQRDERNRPRYNPPSTYNPPTTDEEKREINAIRKRLGMNPLYPEVA